MVIDTSALVAILQNEPERRRFDEAIEAASPTRWRKTSGEPLLCKGSDFSHTDVATHSD